MGSSRSLGHSEGVLSGRSQGGACPQEKHGLSAHGASGHPRVSTGAHLAQTGLTLCQGLGLWEDEHEPQALHSSGQTAMGQESLTKARGEGRKDVVVSGALCKM